MSAPILYPCGLRAMIKLCMNREPGPDSFHESTRNVVSGLARMLEVMEIPFSTSSEENGRN